MTGTETLRAGTSPRSPREGPPRGRARGGRGRAGAPRSAAPSGRCRGTSRSSSARPRASTTWARSAGGRSDGAVGHRVEPALQREHLLRRLGVDAAEDGLAEVGELRVGEAADEALRADDADLPFADVDRRPAPVEDRDPRRFQDAGDLVLAVRVPVVVRGRRPRERRARRPRRRGPRPARAPRASSGRLRARGRRSGRGGRSLLDLPRREGEQWMSPADATRIGTAPILPPPPEERPRRVTAPLLWKVRHAHGTDASHLQTPSAGIVTARDARVPHGGLHARPRVWLVRFAGTGPGRGGAGPVRRGAPGIHGLCPSSRNGRHDEEAAAASPRRGVRTFSAAAWLRGRGGGSSDRRRFPRQAGRRRPCGRRPRAGRHAARAAAGGLLLKAWDGDVLVDVIYSPSSGPVTDEVIERGEEREVLSTLMRVMALEDVMVTKLLALDETHLDFAGSLDVARPLREQIDWTPSASAPAGPRMRGRSSRSSRSSGSSADRRGLARLKSNERTRSYRRKRLAGGAPLARLLHGLSSELFVPGGETVGLGWIATSARSRRSGRRPGRTRTPFVPNPGEPSAPRSRLEDLRPRMLPYPSGELHMGHVRNYMLGEVVAHFRRRMGYAVLAPDGLRLLRPARRERSHQGGPPPAEATERNIAAIRRQMERMGWAIDWDRVFATHDPAYYRWTQWLFLRFFDRDLAYRRGACQVVPERPDRPRERAGDRRALRALRRGGRGPEPRAMVLPDHGLCGRPAGRDGAARVVAGARPRHAAQLDRTQRGAELVFRVGARPRDPGLHHAAGHDLRRHLLRARAQHPLVADLVAGTEREAEVVEYARHAAALGGRA